jgi:hypothetical protein
MSANLDPATLRAILEQIREADLDAWRMSNVLYNLPHRVQADGTAVLTGADQDQLRDIRLAFETRSREMRKGLAVLQAALADETLRLLKPGGHPPNER